MNEKKTSEEKKLNSTKKSGKKTNQSKQKTLKYKQNRKNTSFTAEKSENKRNTQKRKNAVKQNVKNRKPSRKNSKNSAKETKSPLHIIPLGGLEEIGKNMTLYEYEGDMFIVDCGMSFPDEETPGIDIVIPDFTYLIENKDKIKGLVITHGHEDHIGAIPYLLKEINVPIYATRLTLGLISGKLEEHKLLTSAKLINTKPGDTVTLGKFSIEFIHVNHSIPDAVALAITCKAGTVIQTGDFKIDTTPIEEEVFDFGRFAELGKKGVLALLSDSTNAERPGYTPSERIVGNSFSTLFAKAEGRRIIVATFSSNIHRIQQIIDEAAKCNRKVAISGRSMINVVNIASEMGYLKVPSGVLIEIETLKNYRPDQIVIITTGSQGEPLSALHRIAFSGHKSIELIPGDNIIISATPIPGNEKTVGKVVNELLRKGANVIYERMYDVHVSGHACQEELKLMLSLVKPKYFIPVHGEEKHLIKHASLATAMGIPKENIVISAIGNVIEVKNSGVKITDSVPAGRVMVDGLGVGDVGNVVLKDRMNLADNGIIVIALTLETATNQVIGGPQVESRGFVYVKESEELMDGIYELACNIIEKCYISGIKDRNTLRIKLRDGVAKYIYEKTRRTPIILPVITES